MGEKSKAAEQPDWAELYDEALVKTGVVVVSSVQGRPVTRYGTRVLIGAVHDPEQPNKLIFNTEESVTLPRDEAQRFRREYVRHLAEGDLVLGSQKSSEVGAPRKPTTSVAAKGPPDGNESRRE